MKWLVIGIGVLCVAGFMHHRMRRAHHEHWMDVDA
jgi:hypothetical protein